MHFSLEPSILFKFNPLRTGNPSIGTLANSEDSDEMPHNTAFHQGQSALFAKTKQSSEKEIQYILEIIACNPSI